MNITLFIKKQLKIEYPCEVKYDKSLLEFCENIIFKTVDKLIILLEECYSKEILKNYICDKYDKDGKSEIEKLLDVMHIEMFCGYSIYRRYFLAADLYYNKWKSKKQMPLFVQEIKNEIVVKNSIYSKFSKETYCLISSIAFCNVLIFFEIIRDMNMLKYDFCKKPVKNDFKDKVGSNDFFVLVDYFWSEYFYKK